MKITLSTTCLRWARERASLSVSDLASKMHVSEDKVQQWEECGTLTLAQADKLAHVTHTPIGYLFLPEPPVEQLPVTDFRTVGTQSINKISPELIDTMNDALRRQDWYRDYAESNGAHPFAYIGSLQVTGDIVKAVAHIRGVVDWDEEIRSQSATWEKALAQQIEAIEEAGILVMRNGVVGNNTSRPLEVSEFRGFALSDPYAPLIFINNKDAKSAQMFTLAHELVHLFIGVSGVSNLNQTYAPDDQTEQFCNKVAAELLVPLNDLKRQWNNMSASKDVMTRLVKHFKVSELVILRRLQDADILTTNQFQMRYTDALAQLFTGKKVSSGGGDFYRTLRTRLGRRFASAVAESVLEGTTLYRDAYSLLGVSNADAVRKLAREVGVAA